MVHEMTGDLLSCDADYICHQTNFYGVMGAGVAASIHSKLLSPAAYSVYQRLCRKMGRDLLGEVVNTFSRARLGVDLAEHLAIVGRLAEQLRIERQAEGRGQA